MAILLALACQNLWAQDNEAAWKETIQRVIPSVVTLRVSKVRSFDTETNALLDGTGFVVDAERGIILTNRHVVSTGPVRAEAVFSNQEEVKVQRIYADPVHDFAFVRYDPGDLRTAPQAALPLAPAAAEVGRAIRVLGNDAGNRMSILDGTISRLDHIAPKYGAGRYNDFNTFYIQASSGTSGGSSGSPVVDLEGRVVALNAAAQTSAATSYFLPLDRVKRALELIRQDKPVPRGGLLATLEQLPYAELRRLGLTEHTETGARAADSERSGLLVVRSTIKESPASKQLRPGDILVRIQGVEFPDFVQLEGVLDENVGQTVGLAVERQGSVLELSLEVTDLHEVTPFEYITMGNAILHPMSYQQARNFNVPLDTIYVAYHGYMLGLAEIETGSILREINGRALESLDDVEEALAGLRHGDTARFRFTSLRAPNSSKLRSARIARSWFTAERCSQGAESHEWKCKALAPPPPPEPIEPRSAPARKFDDPRLQAIAPSLVHVRFDMPFSVSGIQGRRYSGAGLIVDAKRGWVVVDRNTVPEAVGDAVLTFNGSLEVAAEVAYVHPVHSLAILQYDPERLGHTPVSEAEFAPQVPAQDEEVFLAGFRPDQELAIHSYKAGSPRLINAGSHPLGWFRESNLEVFDVKNADTSLSGVLLDPKGRVSALWSGFFLDASNQRVQVAGGGTRMAHVQRMRLAGLPVEHVQGMLDHLKRGAAWRSLEVDWEAMPLSVALRRGLPETWRSRVAEHDPQRLQMLIVNRAVAGTPAAGALQPGDILLSIDGSPATRPLEVENAVAGRSEVVVLVWRNGQELELQLDTVELGWAGLREVLFWVGALLHDPHRGIAAQLGIAPRGVFVQEFTVASPAHRSLHPLGCFQITRLNEVETPDLRSFVEALQRLGDASSVRVEAITNKGTRVFGTVQLAPEHWPAELLRFGPEGWQRSRLTQ